MHGSNPDLIWRLDFTCRPMVLQDDAAQSRAARHAQALRQPGTAELDLLKSRVKVGLPTCSQAAVLWQHTHCLTASRRTSMQKFSFAAMSLATLEKMMPAPGAAYVCINCLLCYAASQKLLEAWPLYGRSALRK